MFAVCVGNDTDKVGLLLLAVRVEEADGLALGTMLGLKEGHDVGTRLGLAVSTEGFGDCRELGDTEGRSDGLKLGTMVGKRDGALVTGRTVGRSVGTLVGSAVGGRLGD